MPLVDGVTGRKAPQEPTRPLLEAADEFDLVRSGLDNTMRAGYNAMPEALITRDGVHDLRAAAFVVAL